VSEADADELAGLVVTQSLIFTAFAAAGVWHLYLLLWLAPLATCAKTLANLRNLAEHVHVPDDPGQLPRWRTLRCNPIEWFFFARHWLLLPVLAIEGLPLSEARERTRTLSRTHFGSRLMQIGGLVLFEWLAFWLLADLLFIRLRANGELIALLPAFLASTLHAAAWASAYARVTRHEPHDTAELERIFR